MAEAYTGWNIFGVIDGVTSVDVIAVGEDRAAVRWTLGLPGDEEITGVSILELDDGLISAETVYYDSTRRHPRDPIAGPFLGHDVHKRIVAYAACAVPDRWTRGTPRPPYTGGFGRSHTGELCGNGLAAVSA